MRDDDVLTEPVARRIEVFTGSGRRRKWSAGTKARIVAESYASSVGEVADRHGLAKTQLFTWRREARSQAAAKPGALQFAPVIVEPLSVPARAASRPKRLGRHKRRGGDVGIIEVEIGGVAVWVGRGADAKTVAAVLRTLKAMA